MAKVQVLVGGAWLELSAPKDVADAAKIAGERGVAGGTFGFKTDKGEVVTSGKVPASQRLEIVEIPADPAEDTEGD